MCMAVYVSNGKFFESGKIRMKCVKKYDASTEGASRKFLDTQPLMKLKFS